MTKVKAFAAILLGGLALWVGLQPAVAAVVQPCLTNAASGTGGPAGSAITVLPVSGGSQTYCQSAFGWSDAWFATSQPSTYNQHLDVLSGDIAPSLFYTINGAKVGTGNAFNFLSPWVDGGTLNA